MKASAKNNQDTKWVFVKKGTCSRTLFYILNREYDNPMEQEEIAADPLAGGILQHGYQCGLLFGAVLGVGAESYQRSNSIDEAINKAIYVSQKTESEFKELAGSPDCFDLTDTDFSSGKQMAKYMLSGKFYSCFKLADKWAPHIIQFLEKAFGEKTEGYDGNNISCASMTLAKMGASEKEQAIVAGLAGGVGLSGNACGALSAVVWYQSLKRVRRNEKIGIKNPEGEELINAFLEQTNYEFECSKICRKTFKSAQDHKEYLQDGGCAKLIDLLATF